MDPCTTCSQVPQYQNLEHNENYRDNPVNKVKSLNDDIAKVNSQNNLVNLAGVITAAAIIAFGSLATVMTLSSIYLSIPLAVLMNLLGVSIVAFEYGQYNEYQTSLKETIDKINEFFEKYGTEFVFMNRHSAELDFSLSVEDIEVIKIYCEAFPHYQVRYQTHYKVTGGETDKGPIKQLEIKQICQKDNQELVQQTYKPWLDLIVKLGKKNLPSELITLVGKMAGFGLSNGMCSYGDATLFCEGRENIRVAYFGEKESQNFIISTPEELIKFIETTSSITLD